MSFLDHKSLRLTALSPVHIGSGESFDPISFFIDRETLYNFDPIKAVNNLKQEKREEFYKLSLGSGTKSLKKIQQFLFENRKDLLELSNFSISVSPKVQSFYQEYLTRDSRNLSIDRVCFDPLTQQPIIPGSSIKGSIRTALLDFENKNPGENQKTNKKEIEQKLFEYKKINAIQYDPLRLLHIDDATNATNNLTISQLSFAHLVYKNNVDAVSKNNVLKNTIECLLPFNSFSSSLNIYKGDPSQDIQKHYSLEQIADACNRFYRPQLKEEFERLKKSRKLDPEWSDKIQKLETEFGKKGKFLLRIGANSGAVSHTLNGLRKIQSRTAKGSNFISNPKTQSVFSRADTPAKKIMPFGWVLAEYDSDDLLDFNDYFNSFNRDILVKKSSAVQSYTEFRKKEDERAEESKMSPFQLAFKRFKLKFQNEIASDEKIIFKNSQLIQSLNDLFNELNKGGENEIVKAELKELINSKILNRIEFTDKDRKKGKDEKLFSKIGKL